MKTAPRLSQVAVFLLALTPVAGRGAIETPAVQLVSGTISASSTVRPVTGDRILAINVGTNQTESFGSVEDGSIYTVEISKTSSFNGTPMTLRLQKGNSIFSLLDTSSGSEVRFPFSGGLLPVRVSIAVTVGPQTGTNGSGNNGGGTGTTGTGTGTTTTGTTTGTTKSACEGDVNGDGVCDQKDIDRIKDFLSGKLDDPKNLDLNGDGIVNTRDVIQAIKSIVVQKKPQSQ